MINKMMNVFAVLTCKNCFSKYVYDYIPDNLNCCPKCKCSNPDLLRIRIWKNGNTAYLKREIQKFKKRSRLNEEKMMKKLY
jgi:hypothetical protein